MGEIFALMFYVAVQMAPADIYQVQIPFWDSTVALTKQNDGSWVDEHHKGVHKLEGTIFSEQVAGEGTYTVDINSICELPPANVWSGDSVQLKIKLGNGPPEIMKITRRNKEKLLFEMVGGGGMPTAVYYVFGSDRQLNHEEIWRYDTNDIKREFQKCLDKTSKKARLLFITAEDHNDVVAVKWLLAQGMSPNFAPYDSPLLLHAIKEKHNQIATMLLEHGVDVNTTDDSGDTALHVVCFPDNLEIAKLLIQKHAKVDAKNVFGETPLMEAAGMGRTRLVRLFLDNHAGVNAVKVAGGDAGATVLMCAVGGGHLEIVGLLLDRGANIDAKDRQMTPLMRAANDGCLEMVKLLLDRGADINAKDSYNGYNAITYAVRNDKVEVVKLLLQRGAKCDDINKDVKTHQNAETAKAIEELCVKGSEKK